MLVIEVDGVSHEEESVKIRDIIKSQELTKAGYTVLRFTDDDIFSSLDWVEKQIKQVVEELEIKMK